MRTLPRQAWALALGGAIPFVMLTASLSTIEPVLGVSYLDRYLLLSSYAAIIITFIGAVHWGVAIASDHPQRERVLSYSVLPSLLAWASINVFISWSMQMSFLAGLIVMAFIADRVLIFAHVATGYARLRLVLTLIVTSSLLVAAALV